MARVAIRICVFLLLAANLPAQGNDMPVETIIDKHIAARGGMDKIKQLQSIRMNGIYIYRGQEFPLMISWAQPKSFRLETGIDDGTEIYLFDGEAAHALDAQTGAKRVIRDKRVEHFVKMMADLDGALVDYQNKGHRVQFAGTETIEGRQAYVLEVSLHNGPVEQWLIDAQSFLLVKRSSTFNDDEGQHTQAIYFMDYEQVGGMMFPHYFERNVGHYVYGYEIAQIEFNPMIGEKQE